MDSKAAVEVAEVQQVSTWCCSVELPREPLRLVSSQGGPPSSKEWEEKEQQPAEQTCIVLEPMVSNVAGEGRATKTSRASMVLGGPGALPAGHCAVDGADPSGTGPELGAADRIDSRADGSAALPEAVDTREEVKHQRPSFAGTWDLAKTDGDMDKFMADYGNGWIMRNAAKMIKYGVGRVVVECQQDGDDFTFSRVPCDPSKSKSHVHITVGQGPSRFQGDMGYSTCTSLWEGESLRLNMTSESSGLGMTYLMYLGDAGNLVEEMTSCKGTVARNIFTRRA